MAFEHYDDWGGSNLQRIKLDVITSGATTKSFLFAVNPQNYKEAHTVRTSLQQTRTANTVQRFGEGPTQITISGHFGDRAKGYNNAMLLRHELTSYLAMFSDNNYSDSVMAFRNYTLNDFWYVEPASNFSVEIDANSPTLINYSITFYIVADMTKAQPNDRTETTLGNDKVNSTPAYITANTSDPQAAKHASENLNTQTKKHKDTKTPKKKPKKKKKKKKAVGEDFWDKTNSKADKVLGNKGKNANKAKKKKKNKGNVIWDGANHKADKLLGKNNY